MAILPKTYIFLNTYKLLCGRLCSSIKRTHRFESLNKEMRRRFHKVGYCQFVFDILNKFHLMHTAFRFHTGGSQHMVYMIENGAGLSFTSKAAGRFDSSFPNYSSCFELLLEKKCVAHLQNRCSFLFLSLRKASNRK